MKPSEMTNEELADYIVNVIGGGIFKEYYAEAAARLRRPTPVDDDLLKMARDIDAKNAEIRRLKLAVLANKARKTKAYGESRIRAQDMEIEELQRRYADACRCCDDAERRLKVAEDALGEIAEYDRHPEGMDDPGCADGHCCSEKARNALAAIAEEWDNNQNENK